MEHADMPPASSSSAGTAALARAQLLAVPSLGSRIDPSRRPQSSTNAFLAVVLVYMTCSVLVGFTVLITFGLGPLVIVAPIVIIVGLSLKRRLDLAWAFVVIAAILIALS